MTLLTHAHLLDRYGPLLTESQLGEVLHLAPGTLRNQRRRTWPTTWSASGRPLGRREFS